MSIQIANEKKSVSLFWLNEFLPNTQIKAMLLLSILILAKIWKRSKEILSYMKIFFDHLYAYYKKHNHDYFTAWFKIIDMAVFEK